MTVRPVAPRTAVTRDSWQLPDRRVPRLLWAMLVAAVTTTVGFGTTAGLALAEGRRVVETLAEGSGSASIDIARAHAALSDADRLATAHFLSLTEGGGRLGGPGRQYQENIKNALQRLADVTETTLRGRMGADDTEAIETLIVLYVGYIDQAYSNVDNHLLGITYLIYGSNLMHKLDDGILARVDKLAVLGADDINDRLSTPWLSRTVLALQATGGAALVGILVGIQVFLVRNFRRLVNPALFVATALVIVVTVLASLQLADTRNVARNGGAALESTTGLWAARAVLGDTYGARARSLVVAPDDAGALSEIDACGPAGQLRVAPTDAERCNNLYAILERGITATERAEVSEVKGEYKKFVRACGPADQLPVAPTDAERCNNLYAILEHGITATERAEVSEVKGEYKKFVRIDRQVAELTSAGRPQERELRRKMAVSMTLESGSDRLPDTFRQADGALGVATEHAQRRFDEVMDDAASGGRLGITIPLLAAGAAILMILGMYIRIHEYR